MKKELRKVENACFTGIFGGWGSLKASLLKVFSFAKNEQENSEQVIKKRCHAELDSASRVVVCHVKRKVGKIPNRVWNDNSPNGEGNGINSITNLSPYRPNALTPLAKTAFTMAEILLSLTIIGVVAAITLPSLTGNINERTWNTQRKALFARVSQAISLMPSLNGYGLNMSDASSGANYLNFATEAFLTSGLSKVLKINNICDAEHFADCGISSTYTTLPGGTNSWSSAPTFRDFSGRVQAPVTATDLTELYGAAFETANGESVLAFYNPECKDASGVDSIHFKVCVNFIYDLNGIKGPNAVGKDIGVITVLNPSDPIVVSPIPLTSDAGSSSQYDAGRLCTSQNSESRLPNIEELGAVYVNPAMFGALSGEFYWSSSLVSSSEAKIQHSYNAYNGSSEARGNVYNVRCIKR